MSLPSIVRSWSNRWKYFKRFSHEEGQMVAIKPVTDDFVLIDFVDDLISVFFSSSSEDRQLEVLR